IAERAIPMRVAMSILGIGALFAGVLQIPGVTDVVEGFLEGTFEESKYHDTVPSEGSAYLGLLAGGVLSIVGIAIAYVMYMARPGISARLIGRFDWLHDFLERKWYFDEAIDGLIVRPSLAAGRWANSTFERYVIQGVVIGATGLAKGANAGVRGAQSGYLRSYALLLVTGFAGLGLYFLLQS
ncbi:MAG TPA: NADH-quinone oxidoreductase subunit L, partial [Solirubrobacterales bacterium]|nr:NADH-quinone oxidoreductase subunit L [Solirubrobacterales bacterium]